MRDARIVTGYCNELCFAEFTVTIKPASVHALEAADLVQTMGAAIELVAGNEFDRGVVGVLCGEITDLQAQPLRSGFFVQTQIGRARGGVPGGLQPGSIAQDKGGIARAHQVFGIGHGLAAVNETATAVFEG